MKKLVHNVETGEVSEVELTAEEVAQVELDREIARQEAEALVIKEAAKASAETKLAALGLTTDDLKALGLGGN
jgi:hypothetical protein